MRWIEAAPLGDDDPDYWMALPVGDHQVMLETDRRRWGCWAMPGMRWTKERFLSQEQHVYDWAPAFHHLRLEPGRLQDEGVPVLRYAPIRSGSVAFLIQDTTRPQTGLEVGIEITHVGPVPRSLPVEARDLWLRSEKQASWQIAPYEALWFWWGVPPGWQQFRIEAEGYAPFSTWVEVKEGIRGLYEVDLAPYRRHPIH